MSHFLPREFEKVVLCRCSAKLFKSILSEEIVHFSLTGFSEVINSRQGRENIEIL